MIVSTTHTVRKADFYLNEQITRASADLVRYFYWSTPIPGAICKMLSTAVTDLQEDPDHLLAGMEKESRRLIRYAEKNDTLVYESWSNGEPDALLKITDLHDAFAVAKGLQKSDREFLKRAAEAGTLDMSLMSGSDGDPISWRVYYSAHPSVRPIRGGSLYSDKALASERQAVGRATRYLVWRDMLRFSAKGFTTYDHGGWYTGNETKLLEINAFKKQFGVRVVDQCDCVEAITWKGKLALRFLEARQRKNAAVSDLA